MRLHNLELYRLLVDIHPVFVRALPVIVDDGKLTKPSKIVFARNNAITQLRDEIKRMGMKFLTPGRASCELSATMLREVQSALESILSRYEDHVDDEAEDLDDFDLTLKYPKLEMVRRHPVAAQDWVSFGRSRSVHGHVKDAARELNRLLDLADALVREDVAAEVPSYADTDNQADLPALTKALRLSEASRKLLEVLEKHHKCIRGNERKGFLRLPGLDHEALDMILSVCCGSGIGPWQQVYFYLQEPRAEKAVPLRTTMCNELKTSFQRGVPTRMALNPAAAPVDMTDGLRLHNLSGRRDVIEFEPPTKTLRCVLDEENSETRQRLAPNHRILKHNVKKGLGVDIAAAIFFLFTCPFFQAHAWNMDSIYVFHGNRGGCGAAATTVRDAPLPSTYLAFCLDNALDNALNNPLGKGKEPEGGPAPLPQDGNPLLLALTVLLLELEMEKSVTLCDDDIDDLTNEPSLHLAVLRYQRSLVENVDSIFHRVIQNCLDLYDESPRDGNADDFASIQIKLFSEVVMPLTRRYRTLRNEPEIQTSGPPPTAAPIRHIEVVPTNLTESGGPPAFLSIIDEREEIDDAASQISSISFSAPRVLSNNTMQFDTLLVERYGANERRH